MKVNWRSIRNGLNTFLDTVSRGKASRISRIITPRGAGGVCWTPKNYENYANETYLKNVIAYKAIDEIAKSVASVTWNQYRRISDDERQEVTDTDIAKRLKRPNPGEGFAFLMLKTTAYLVMCGNAFIERVGPTTGPNKGKVLELYSHRPDRFSMKFDLGSGQLAEFIYTVNGREERWGVDPITQQADILQLKAFHPLNDWWGASATESAAREIDTSNSATEWNKSILDHHGRPGMVFTLIGSVGEEYMDKLEQHLAEQHSGPANAGKNLIISGESGTKAEPWGWNPKDLDFNEGDVRLMRKIAMGYGVPPELLGIQDATFNNRMEARLYFWENTVFFYLNYLRDELNNWLFDEDSDLSIDYCLDDIPALATKRDKLWERAEKSDFLEINEKREMVGLPPTKNGDVILVPASMIPLSMAGASGSEVKEEITEETEEEEEARARMNLLEQGYTDEEIDEMFGLPCGEEKGDEFEESKPYPTEFSCRLQSPDKYERFARVNCYRKVDGKCVDYIFGVKDGKSEVQALRFKKKIWTQVAAKAYCKTKNGSFEA